MRLTGGKMVDGVSTESRAAWEQRVSPLRDDDAEPPVMASVLAELREFMDDDGVVVVGGSRVQRDVADLFYVPETGACMTAQTPGAALATAMDAKLAASDRQVLAVLDGEEFTHAASALGTAKESAIPLVVLVCTDAAGGAADCTAAAEAQGCHVQCVDHADDLQTALAAAFASGEPAVVVCPVASPAVP